jgi:hypothetical protein
VESGTARSAAYPVDIRMVPTLPRRREGDPDSEGSVPDLKCAQSEIGLCLSDIREHHLAQEVERR